MSKPSSDILESPTFQVCAVIMAWVAVFGEPVYALFYYLTAPDSPPLFSIHQSSAVLALDFVVVVFFGSEFWFSYKSYGKVYFKSVYAWINLLVIVFLPLSHLVPALGLPDPLMLRILRVGSVFARVGLIQKAEGRKSDIASQDESLSSEDDIRFSLFLMAGIFLMAGFRVFSVYASIFDVLQELAAYGLIVIAFKYKTSRNRERIKKVVLYRIENISKDNREKIAALLGEGAAENLNKETSLAVQNGAKNEFDVILDQINLIFMNLKRFVSDRALREARGESVIPDGQPVALMFTDLEDFTFKTQSMGQAILAPLGRYFKRMVEVIIGHSGDVERFIGDGIFSYFYVKDAPKDSCSRAFDCTLSMVKQAEVMGQEEDWNAFFQEEGWQWHHEFKTRFGLHYGEVTSGCLGSNNAQVRDETTLMGDNVNLAARMEALNKKYKTYVLLSEEFYAALSDDRRIHCRMVDYATVKGREDKPVRLYTVDLEDKPREFIDKYNEGLDLYFKGDWYEALLCFEKAYSIDPDDGPNLNLMHRIHSSRVFSLKAIQHLHEKLGHSVPALDEFKKEIELSVVKQAFRPPFGFLDRGSYWVWEEK